MKKEIAKPDSTAVRVALWRAQHAQSDPEPHILSDEIGLRLVAPSPGWRNRPDMKGPAAARYRAGVVIRARFVEDLVAKESERGTAQYALLGAGLDTFAQRNPKLASRLQIFEIDRASHQTWKEKRLLELGYGIPGWLHLVPVDFESGESWLSRLLASGFGPAAPSVVSCMGVSMYLTRDAITSTLKQAGTLASGSVFAMTFLLPGESNRRSKPPVNQKANKESRQGRKPFISFFDPQEIIALARKAGFREYNTFQEPS
jgi:methyltransferase (TIGR00027 family)